ncbi:MAG: hypothetical protein AB1782_20645 [Cyanobacteriota bacterium]
MKLNRGASLAQYAIIIALVALFAIPVYFFLGQNIVDFFTNFSTMFGNINVNMSENIAETNKIDPGELGGTSSEPQTQCNNGECSIDFGEFILNGIPENFGELVQTGGNSGGIDELASLLDQIADFLEEEGDVDGSVDFKDLANLAHTQAMFKEQLENMADLCVNNMPSQYASSQQCFKDQWLLMGNLDISSPPAGDLLPDLGQTGQLAGYGINENTRLDLAMYQKINDPNTFDALKNKFPPYKMVEIYDKIMKDNSYDVSYADTIKNITKKLFLNINDLAFNSSAISKYVGNIPPEHIVKYDIETGAEIGAIYNQAFTVEDILKPDTSLNTNINAALICVTGDNYDNGDECSQ